MRRISSQLGQRDLQEALPRSWSVKSSGEPLLEVGAGSWKDLRSTEKRPNFIVAKTLLKANRCVVMFGKSKVSSLGVTVLSMLKDKHVCIEWERTRVG